MNEGETQPVRIKIRKRKTQNDLQLARNIKGSKKKFTDCIRNTSILFIEYKGKNRKKLGAPHTVEEQQIMYDTDKTEILTFPFCF